MTRVLYLFVIAALCLVGCGGDGGGTQETPLPCAGACPVELCIANTCIVERDTSGGDDTAEDAQDDAADDVAADTQEDADVPEPDVPAGCVSDDRCGQGQICDDTQEPPICRPGCREHSECDADQYCEAEAAVCAEGCRDDASCGGVLVCDLDSRVCEAPACREDVDCPEGQFCENRACAVGCRIGACPSEQYCDQDTRTCAEGCGVDSHCPEDSWCRDNVCAIGCRDDDGCPEGEECVELRGEETERLCLVEACRRDSQCDAGFYCGVGDFDRDVCLPGCRTADGDCPEGLVCDPETRQCGPMTCAADDECGEGEICTGQRCVIGCRDDGACVEGQTCELDVPTCTCASLHDCVGGAICDLGLCRSSCDSDAECPGQETCDPELRVCTLGCRDDTFEPNDELLGSIPVQGGLLEDLRMCFDALPAAPDCYEFEVEGHAPIRVDALFDDELGDLDMELFNPALESVAASRDDAPPILQYMALESGVHRLCVYPNGEPPLRLSYRLDFQF